MSNIGEQGWLPGEITDAERRAYELERFRSFFPKFSPDKTGEDVALEADDAQGVDETRRGKVHRFHSGFKGKLFGGTEGLFSHEPKYVVIATERAPFGVEQLWSTDGMTIEDSGPDDLAVQANGSQQVVLIESGTGAVSRFKKPSE